jgi:hypothetical protein
MADGDRSKGEPRRLSVEEKRWEWLAFNTKMKPHKKVFLLVLFRWHIRYRDIFLSTERLQEFAGVCDKTARDGLKELQQEGWYSRQFRGRGDTGRVYSYRLTFPQWFSKDRDAFLLLAEKAMLERRLDFRMDTDPACFDNWPDHDAMMERIAEIEKQFPGCP